MASGPVASGEAFVPLAPWVQEAMASSPLMQRAGLAGASWSEIRAVLILGMAVSVAWLIGLPSLPAEASRKISVACRKGRLLFYGVQYLLLAKDTKFASIPDPGRAKGEVFRTKRIIFVRHGESVWNEVFNRGFGPSFPMRLVKALLRELRMLFAWDSDFFDSPLSEKGIGQVRDLAAFLEKRDAGQGAMAAVEGGAEETQRQTSGSRDPLDFIPSLHASAPTSDEEKGGVIFVSSNLRRAISTMLIGFGARLNQTGEACWIFSCLQEISRNVDTLALAAPFSAPEAPSSFVKAGSSGENASALQELAALVRRLYKECLLPSYHLGNKAISGNGGERLHDFCGLVFDDKGPCALSSTVVVTGHSLYFRSFFQTFLPHTSYHVGKNCKMVNCGVVGFELQELREVDPVTNRPLSAPTYRIAPESLRSLYGGFEEPKKKKSKKA